jgi:hypothetical protein
MMPESRINHELTLIDTNNGKFLVNEKAFLMNSCSFVSIRG